MALKVSNRGLKLIAEFEGESLKLYDDPAGHCTIGYGHLVHLNRCDGREPAEFKRGINKARALALLRSDARSAERAVNTLVRVPLSQSQFDALVSFTYNLGSGSLERSTLRKVLNRGDYAAVPEQLRRWNKAGGKVLKGLVRRREAEAKLWSSGGRPSAAARSAAVTIPAATGPYRVVAGDNLTKIAARFHTTVNAIATANDLANPNLIRVGQKLVIPAPKRA